MEKHRKFLIFYSLYLGLIILVLTIFGNPQDKNIGVTKESNVVCLLSTSSTKYSKSTKGQVKLCCESNTSFMDYPEEDL